MRCRSAPWRSDDETEEVLFDITENGQEVVLLKGGRGGLGNQHFHSSHLPDPVLRNPVSLVSEMVQAGTEGARRCGPGRFSPMRAKHAPRQHQRSQTEDRRLSFTTLVPNIGIVPYRDGGSFVMADIPGIIEGASEGKGLGLRFLRPSSATACCSSWCRRRC